MLNDTPRVWVPASLQYSAGMLSEVRFGDVVVLRDRRRLLVAGREAVLGSRAFDVLVHLIDHRHRFVGKQELLETVWAGEAVEDGNLHVQVHALRRLLGRDTIAGARGRGYRFTALLAGRPVARQADPGDAAAADAQPDRHDNALYGRDADLAALDHLARSHRLLSLVGPGGIGKTRLAQALVRRLAADPRAAVCWIDLSVVDTPARCLDAVAQALLLSSHQPWTVDALAARLQAMDGWLVLDNCEHVAEVVAPLVTALLAPLSRWRVIATSRRAMGIPQECVFPVAPLSLPPADLADPSSGRWDAVELLLDRARRAVPGFSLAPGELAEVHALARRLDGLPLAIELAAARVAVVGVRAMLAQLGSGVAGLSTSRPGVADRHRTMASVVLWSCQLLSAEEQVLLRRLAVFSGTFSLAQAAAVAGHATPQDWTFVDRFQALVQHMLVQRQPGDHGEQGRQGDGARWRLLETTRHVARDALQRAGEVTAVRRAHAVAMAASMQALDDAYVGGTGSEQALCVEADHLLPDVLAALDTCSGRPDLHSLGAALFASSARFLFWRGHAGALQAWADRTADCEGLSPVLEAAVRLAWCHVPPAALAGPLAQSASLRRARALFTSAGDRVRAMHAGAWLALRLGDAGQLQAAGEALAQAAAAERPADPARLRAWRLHVGATLAQMHSAAPTDLIALDEMRDDLQAAGDGDGRTAHMLAMDAAQAHLLRGDFAEAQQRLQALQDDTRTRDLDCVRLTWLLGYLAMAELGLERTAQAAERLRQALSAARQADLLQATADVLAWCLAQQGRNRAAVELIGAVHGRLKRRGVAVDAYLSLTSEAVRRLTRAACSEADLQRWALAGAAWSDADLRRMLSGQDRRYVP